MLTPSAAWVRESRDSGGLGEAAALFDTHIRVIATARCGASASQSYEGKRYGSFR
jgi:hypothetical protein